MTESPYLLLFIVFGLGMRHGLDLDHLATIDSIAQTLQANPYLSKKVGLLFSLGHGLVVILISVIIANGFIHASIPLWLASLGNWISIIFLFIFGFLSLWKIIFKLNTIAPIARMRSYFFRSTQQRQYSALIIIGIGALFALSFDTFTQVALFSLSMSSTTWAGFSILLGTIFMLGMMTSDGLNGFIVATCIRRLKQKSNVLSNALGFLIACFSLGLGIKELGYVWSGAGP